MYGVNISLLKKELLHKAHWQYSKGAGERERDRQTDRQTDREEEEDHTHAEKSKEEV